MVESSNWKSLIRICADGFGPSNPDLTDREIHQMAEDSRRAQQYREQQHKIHIKEARQLPKAKRQEYVREMDRLCTLPMRELFEETLRYFKSYTKMQPNFT